MSVPLVEKHPQRHRKHLASAASSASPTTKNVEVEGGGRRNLLGPDAKVVPPPKSAASTASKNSNNSRPSCKGPSCEAEAGERTFKKSEFRASTTPPHPPEGGDAGGHATPSPEDIAASVNGRWSRFLPPGAPPEYHMPIPPGLSLIEQERKAVEIRDFYKNYDPMEGVLTAVVLGGFFAFVCLLVMYKTKCKPMWKNR